jgi:hypothetical protein
MLVPTLYVCHQVEELRRQDERRDAQLWRLLRGERGRTRSRKALRERPSSPAKWVWELLGSPGL